MDEARRFEDIDKAVLAKIERDGMTLERSTAFLRHAGIDPDGYGEERRIREYVGAFWNLEDAERSAKNLEAADHRTEIVDNEAMYRPRWEVWINRKVAR